MKPSSLLPVFVMVAVMAPSTSLRALEPPRIIPHSGHADKSKDAVFQTLKSYFSDIGLSKFNLVSADEATGTIVAKQSGIDMERWRNWAACETDPLHMIYRFDDGTVTLTANVSRALHDTAFVTVSADFEGTYVLGNDSTTVACKSNGTLEESILTVAGSERAAGSR